MPDYPHLMKIARELCSTSAFLFTLLTVGLVNLRAQDVNVTLLLGLVMRIAMTPAYVAD